jgi:hypothetical protein
MPLANVVVASAVGSNTGNMYGNTYLLKTINTTGQWSTNTFVNAPTFFIANTKIKVSTIVNSGGPSVIDISASANGTNAKYMAKPINTLTGQTEPDLVNPSINLSPVGAKLLTIQVFGTALSTITGGTGSSENWS